MMMRLNEGEKKRTRALIYTESGWPLRLIEVSNHKLMVRNVLGFENVYPSELAGLGQGRSSPNRFSSGAMMTRHLEPEPHEIAFITKKQNLLR